MLKVRLQRVGKNHEPIYRLVLTDSKNGPKSGKFLEILGNYDARKNDKTILKEDRIKHWISNGAQVSGTVHNILVGSKVIEGKKINVLPKKTPIIKEKPAEEAKAPQAAPEAAPAATVAEAAEAAPEKTEETSVAPTEEKAEAPAAPEEKPETPVAEEEKPQDEVAA